MWRAIGRLIPSWSALNRVGQNKLLKTSYVWFFLVPAVARLAYKEIDLPGTDLTVQELMPFSWQIFYLSAVAFAVATIIYSLSCPAIVRDYQSFGQFQAEGKGSPQLAEYFRQLLLRDWRRIATGRVKARLPEIKRFLQFSVDPRSIWSELEDEGSWREISRAFAELRIDKHELGQAFWYVWELANESRYISRVVSSLFFIAGFVLLALISGQTLYYVYEMMLEDWKSL